jgi:catechol 2,3-dioxygenase-like lactoylglutathione lyase family enzyme
MRESQFPILTGAEPQLFVSNLAVSLDYYQTKLGFQVEFTYGNPPFYAQITRGSAKLNLRLANKPIPSSEPDLLTASITVIGVEELEAEFRQKEAWFHTSMALQPWGAMTFIIKDLDSNLILFAGEPDHVSSKDHRA